MRIKKETLQGYILEEVLASLIKNSGFRLLTNKSQDPIELDYKGNGLVVKGRGSIHQVDVLGQLEWIPTFTFPLRLFAEAKFSKNKMGISVVRNAIGVLNDVNQNYFPNPTEKFRQKYQYNYALFSVSGFSDPASNLAIAHNISLVELGQNNYGSLLDSIRTTTDQLLTIENNHRKRFVKNLRNSLRLMLGTLLFSNDQNENQDIDNTIRTKIEGLVNETREYNELFIAMANGPFMLLLKSDNSQEFINYSNVNPYHKINITWGSLSRDSDSWQINPSSNPTSYTLNFILPKILSRWIFGNPGQELLRASEAKSKYFSNLTIYRKIEGRDLLYRLEYNPIATRNYLEENNSRGWSTEDR